MAIADKITKYSVTVLHTNIDNITRQIYLTLESGGTATISFAATLPNDWLTFNGSATSLWLTSDQFPDVYRVLEGASPAFFTALSLSGLMVGSVHTELDVNLLGKTPADGGVPPKSLPALIQLARREGVDHK